MAVDIQLKLRAVVCVPADAIAVGAHHMAILDP